MEIKLTVEQYNFLFEELLRDEDIIRNKIKSTEQSLYKILIDDDTADEIRDLAVENLQVRGFDANYNLTKKGIILEELIDIFYE